MICKSIKTICDFTFIQMNRAIRKWVLEHMRHAFTDQPTHVYLLTLPYGNPRSKWRNRWMTKPDQTARMCTFLLCGCAGWSVFAGRIRTKIHILRSRFNLIEKLFFYETSASEFWRVYKHVWDKEDKITHDKSNLFWPSETGAPWLLTFIILVKI